MPNTVEIFVRSVNDTNKGFNDAKEGLGKALGAMKGLVASTAPALSGPIIAAAGATQAAFASIGIAGGAFAASVIPQFQDVKKASELYTKAQESAAAGSKSAAKDMEAYKQSLKGMPPATRATAVAFAGLKDNFKKWSDSLTGTTMPIFTRGLKSMSGVLPLLTPLVKTAAGAFKGMMNEISSGLKGGGFKGFLSDANSAAKKTLPDFLKSILNIGVGFAGIIRAFFPFSGVVTGGLEKATKKFREFGAGLKDSAGFKSFMDGVKDKIPGIIQMFKDLASSAVTILSALAPFSGVGLAVASALAAIVAAIPQGAMDYIAPTILAIVVAVKAWAVAQGILNVVMAANPVGLVVLAIAALVAILVVAWQRSEKFRTIVTLAFAATAMGVLTGVKLILQALKYMSSFFLDVVGTILSGAAAAFGWIPGIGGKIKAASKAFGAIKDGATRAFDGAIRKVDQWNGKLLRMITKKKVDIVARTAEAMHQLILFQRYVNSLHGKSITITQYYKKVNAGEAPAYQHYAHGGIVGHAAEGGPRNGMTWVGEQGPELVSLAPGSTVHTAGDSKRMAGGGPKLGATAALALKQLADAIDGKITTIKSKFNAVISIVKQKFSGNQEDSLVAYSKKQLAALEKLATKRDALAKKIAAYKDFAKNVADTVRGYASLDSIGEESRSKAGITGTLTTRLSLMRTFASALKRLAKRGLANALFQQIVGLGPEAGTQMANEFLSMNNREFSQVNSLQSQIGKVAASIGNTAADKQIPGSAAIAKQIENLQKAMDKTADKFADKIAAALLKLNKHKKKAAGGPAGGMTWVGEEGPELLNLPYGSSVSTTGASRRLAASATGGGGQPIQVNLILDGKTLASVLVDPLKGVVRGIAGSGPNSVQRALGV